jgi:predicted 3-demethylubiquinone-9 3-methyltransferase (glyoxalase superfamily)
LLALDWSLLHSTLRIFRADRYWNAIVGNGGEESACGWCKDRWGLSWQITPRALTDALAAGGDEARRAFEAMMPMKKIDVAAIEAARRG